MPHFPKPFFASARRVWRVQLHGKQINLGPDRDAAFRRYHELMAALPLESSSQNGPTIPDQHPLVAEVLDAFVGWLKERVRDGTKAPRTLAWYTGYIQSFVRFATVDYRVAGLTIDQLQPLHVYEWVDAQPNWKTGKWGAMTAVQRALRWAARAGHLKSVGGTLPLAGLEKPAQGRRELLVRPEEFGELLACVRDRAFRDLLEVAWETGARPHELLTVEARFVDLANARWVFPVRQSKGRRVQRVVYLTDKALGITRRLMLVNQDGPLFRNTDGAPWNAYSVNCRFRRLRVAVGRRRLGDQGLLPPKLRRLTQVERRDKARRDAQAAAVRDRRAKIADLARGQCPKYSLYAIRHSWCTHALEGGHLDAVTVSVLMGHKDTTMISRVYAHLAQNPARLRQAVKTAAGVPGGAAK